MGKGANYHKYWEAAEDIIKKYGLKPKDFKASSNWNKKSDVKSLEDQLKAGVKKGSDDSTFRNNQGDLEVKVKDWMTGADIKQVAEQTGAKLPQKSETSTSGYASNKDVSSPSGGWAGGTKAGDPGGTGPDTNKYGSWLDMRTMGGPGEGWFGVDDLDQVRAWHGSENLKGWLDQGDHRGLGGVKAIGLGVADQLWGYRGQPGTKHSSGQEAFGKLDIEFLQQAGATDSHIRKIREGFNRRDRSLVGPWAQNWGGSAGGGNKIEQIPATGQNEGTNTGTDTGTNTGTDTGTEVGHGDIFEQESTGVGTDEKPELPDMSIAGPYTQQAHAAGRAAMGVKTRRSLLAKEAAALGTKQLNRSYRNLSINI